MALFYVKLAERCNENGHNRQRHSIDDEGITCHFKAESTTENSAEKTANNVAESEPNSEINATFDATLKNPSENSSKNT